eukprot:CAMPEP_0169409536 /NCGR_PEP_ID=MMETSP1017-20121227/59298_1 /TAXON_ID=342587 /ORGANISM="Karlodinium micrum, Strain CCMP2283" /LENGTH=313 /DNA_ID=CAMNT_0009516737 /DNA_START=216 /DNA_END=1158 /DNA_ORIENTATION=-
MLTELHLRSNQLGDKCMQDLAAVLKDNNTLEKLYLSGNDLTEEAAIKLSEVLEVNTTLQQLYMNVNRLGDVGAKHLADALLTNSNLQVLYLNHAGIEDAVPQDFVALQKISELLKRNKAGLGPAPGEVVETSEEEEEDEEDEDEDANNEGEESEDAKGANLEGAESEQKEHVGSDHEEKDILDVEDGEDVGTPSIAVTADNKYDIVAEDEKDAEVTESVEPKTESKASQDLKQLRELQREKFEAARAMPTEIKDEKQMLMAMFEQLEQAQKDPPPARLVQRDVSEQAPIPPDEDLPPPSTKPEAEDDLPPPIS